MWPLTVTADPQTKVYGQADPTFSYHVSGLQLSDTVASVLTGALARAADESVAGGPYAISQGTLAANTNYTITFPALTYQLTGLQFSDTAATVLTGSLTRAAGETVGAYAISQGTLAASANYIISFTSNVLTITPATLTITANSTAKTYGQVVTFAGTEFSASGLVTGDSVVTVTLASTGAAASATVRRSMGSPIPR